MAAGVSTTSWTVYHDQFWTGVSETLEQNANVFNAASGNAIRLVPMRHMGHYAQEAFLKAVTGLITRRDITSVSSVSDTGTVSDEHISVKLNRKIGPVADTIDKWRKIAKDAQTFSFLLGQQTGQAMAEDMVNSALNGADAALAGVSSWTVDKTSETTDTAGFTYLIDAIAAMGDRGDRIVTWIMHSKPFYDLMKDGVTNYKIDRVAGVTIAEGTTHSLNRRVIVTDSPSLVSTTTPFVYTTLGLVEDAIEVSESEEREIISDLVTGLENLVVRIQGEYAYNLKVKGFKWDIANGGANPADSAVGTSSNWDKVATSNKSIAGVRLLTN
jgi:Major capsid protein 13-like